MSTLEIVRLVAGRELRDRIRNRAFMIGTGVVLLAVVGFIVGPALFASDETPEFELGIVGDTAPGFAEAVAGSAVAQDIEVDLVEVVARDAADIAVEEGELDAVLVDPDTLLVDGDADRRLRAAVDQARQQTEVLTRLGEAGIDPAEVASLLAGAPPVRVITPSGTEDEAEAGFGLGFFATVLLFMLIQINGSNLLTGTIEEKASRVVEVLLGSIRPWQLLTGKLLGVMVLAIGQLVLFVGAVFAANAAVGAFEIPPAATEAIVVGTLMFLLGFAFYAAMYAAAGSMASSLEDAQASAGPLGFLTTGAYVGTLVGVVPNPDSWFSQALTYFPPTAPFAVPARVAVGSIGVVEIVAASVLTAVAAVLTVRLAGRFYSAGILAGGRLTWRDVWRAEPIR